MIYIDFPDYYPTENIQEDIKPFIESGILVEYKVKETRAYAALEWTIPTAIVAYIVKPYFEAFLQEAGKQHFDILSKKLKTLINRGKQMNVRLISASKSTEKLNKAYNQSMAISILFEIKNGKIIKLLFDNDLEKEDWDNAIDQILEFVIENYENENNNKLAYIIKDFDNEKAFKIYALINKETKLVELYDDRTLMKKTHEK
jgi:hypothetical protein